MRNLWILTRFLLKSGPGKAIRRAEKESIFGRRTYRCIPSAWCLPSSRVGLTVSSGIFRLYLPAAARSGNPADRVRLCHRHDGHFFYGLPLFLSEYYMDSDLVKLLPLPFTPAQIVGAKGFCCLLNEYYLIVLLFFPFLLGYGISAKMGIFTGSI